jgi:TRAP-type C4-dicarboxylate transport system permease small subunit
MDFVGQFKLRSRILDGLPAAAAIVIGLLLAVQGSILTALAHDQIATASEIPMSIPYLCLPIGGLIMIVFGIEAVLSPRAAPLHGQDLAAE